jgi:hypothetical protein
MPGIMEILKSLLGAVGWVIFWVLAICGVALIVLEWHAIEGLTGL